MVLFGDDEVSLSRCSVELPLEYITARHYMLRMPPSIQVRNAIREYNWTDDSDSEEDDLKPYQRHGPWYDETHRMDVDQKARRKALKPALNYSVEDTGSGEIHVRASYVPYEHFQASRAFRDGFTYVEYMDMLKQITLSMYPSALQEARKRLCVWAGALHSQPCWQLPYKSATSTASNVSTPEL